MARTLLHTIGYEGSSIDEFVATLDRVGINLLIDVRDIPLSRKKGFSKRALSERLLHHGIEYLHLKGLGDPKPGRLAARAGRYDEFKRIFDLHLSSDRARLDLGRALSSTSGRRACLLCFERDHSRCHRQIVADAMVRQGNFELQHLGVRTIDSRTREERRRPQDATSIDRRQR